MEGKCVLFKTFGGVDAIPLCIRSSDPDEIVKTVSLISASFGGISLGSTATAIANMTAVTQVHGAAHKAFVVVPLVGGFFIDLINAVVVSNMVGWAALP